VRAKAGAKLRKPDPQQVQQIKSQHANFRAQPGAAGSGSYYNQKIGSKEAMTGPALSISARIIRMA